MSSTKQATAPAARQSKDLLATMSDPAGWLDSVNTAMRHMPGQLPDFPSGPLAAPSFPEAMAAGMSGIPYKIDPRRLADLQNEYLTGVSKLWSDTLEGRIPAPADRRFGDESWQGWHAYLADLYLLNANFLMGMADSVETDSKTKAKLQFATQQLVDAMAPSNFLATNPEAMKKLLDTGGESLRAGIANMLADIEKGRITQTDESAFEIGRNVAVTEGAVIFQNELFQLIQYKPLTATVHQVPLLIVPPCINKYYILDLQPETSFVRYAVGEGYTVFLLSWRSPTEEHASITWDDYAEEGAIRAIEIVGKVTKQPKINMLGFCIGGTILSTALAALAARGEHPAASLSLLTTLLDFSDTGVMDIFIDENFVREKERTIGGIASDGKQARFGILHGTQLATTFSFLRPNDLVWNYVVNNYLKGESPVAFDLLFWNADGTNLPGAFYRWYLRNTYLENKLKVPGAVKVAGQPVDLRTIDMPTYIYASREDHIVPWQAGYASTQLLKGPTRFVLGASGHIAGVINPPAKNKRSHWTHSPSHGKFPADPEKWFEAASEHRGSWWTDWSKWLAGHAGEQVKAPSKPGNAHFKAIEAAPGSYVKVRGK